MTPLMKEAAIHWLLDVDDPWELMRVNWHQHDPFTQSGMWDISDGLEVLGIRLVLDYGFDRRGFLLALDDNEEPVYMAVITYGTKCRECGAIPYDAGVFDEYDDDTQDSTIHAWAVNWVDRKFDHAIHTGVDPDYHNDGCPLAGVTDDEGEDDE